MQPGFNSTDHQSLAGLWAKKYIENLCDPSEREDRSPTGGDRTRIAAKLRDRLRFCSSQAWTKTENLLIKEIARHRIDPSHINPWRIAEDSHQLFEKACENYQNHITPEKFSVIISPQCGQVRQHHTAVDPRLLGFLSMQFHFTGKFLLEELTPVERIFIADYFKVMDDHLYMPLQRAYDAAAQHSLNAPALLAVRQLLPLSTRIAEFIAAHVAEQNSSYRTYSGYLSNTVVKTSSIRDIEMFQIYLCLCVLEESMTSVQEELFPLCVMLYPPLKVQWNLVRQLVEGLNQELQRRLNPENYKTFSPYLTALQSMFSINVFPEEGEVLPHALETKNL
ncbi:hypothetical protein [Leptolyngbya sp. FACHB-16]|uniref:hypothetical protein n=1 Tax=unclassified Leptolyngbya TaxID=2650499 RepID=UPI0016891226|nr:hypothetical protein [Leptolyngbya sp. FACHB-16]MBD2155532.1 hypothetical protein [Leptolyngbya sp. FACHB-16]